jgi:hypothetical protein
MSWEREVNTTVRDYIREETPEILRQRILLAILNDRGLITMNHEGTAMDWKVRYRQAPLQGFGEMGTVTFSRQNRWKTAVLDWRQLIVPDMMTKKEKLVNKGTAAIIKVYDEMAPLLMEDMEEQFGDQLYNDGNTNTDFFHGVESFLGAGSLLSGAPVANPNSTYAGLSCALGAYNGSWSNTNTWPIGTGDSHYDFWSPLIVDYTSANSSANNGWEATTKDWRNTCVEATRFMILHAQKNKSKRTMMDLVLLDRDMYRRFVQKYQQEERIHVSPNEGSSGAYKLGFKNMQNFDGVDITWEYGTPANVGYGFAMDAMELRSLQAELFEANGPVMDETSQSWRFWVDCYGNLKVRGVRNFGKLAALT